MIYNKVAPHRRLAEGIRALACGLAIITSGFSAMALDYPTKAVKIVVPTPPGGPSDSLVRIVGEKLAAMWKHSVLVENRPGATSILGTTYVAQAPADGYTLLLMVDSTMTMIPHAYKDAPYSVKSIQPIMTMVNVPAVLAASTKVPAATMPEFITLAKAHPGEMSVSFGTFSAQLMATQLQMLAGIKLIQVPYKGAAEVTQSVSAGDVSMGIGAYANFREGKESARFRVLASSGIRRSPSTPSVPTLGELGFPGFESGTWLGLAAPAGTPPAIVDKLFADVSQVMAMPEVKEKLTSLDMEYLVKSPSDTAELISRESTRWGKVIRDAGIVFQ